MKYILFLLGFLPYLCFAQLGWRQDVILEKYGNIYDRGISNNGMPFLVFKRDIEKPNGETIYHMQAYYFDASNICKQSMIIEPSSEANNWISNFNNDFVKIGEYKWKDYEKGIMYTIEIKGQKSERAIYITEFYDN